MRLVAATIAVSLPFSVEFGMVKDSRLSQFHRDPVSDARTDPQIRSSFSTVFAFVQPSWLVHRLPSQAQHAFVSAPLNIGARRSTDLAESILFLRFGE